MGRLPNIPPEVACPDQFFYHKLQALTSVGLVPVVLVVVTHQRLVALCGIKLNGCGPLEFRMIPNEQKEPVILDVQRGKLRRFPLPFKLVSGAFLALAPLGFRLTLSGRLATLGGDHHGLGGSLDIIFQC